MLRLRKALMEAPQYRNLPGQRKVMQPIFDASVTMREMVQDYLDRIGSEKGVEELEGISPDATSLLRAIRCLSTPARDQDEESATMQKLANLVDPRADTPRPIRGQAWALLAHVYWNRMDFSPSTADPGTQLKELYRAAECANKAFANLTTVSGEVPPLAELFNIAMHIEECGLRSPKTRADNSPNHAERFADLSYLWAVVDILKAERIMPYSWFEFGVKYVVEEHLKSKNIGIEALRTGEVDLPDDLHDSTRMVWFCIDLQWMPRL